jgi:hypothetical protein
LRPGGYDPVPLSLAERELFTLRAAVQLAEPKQSPPGEGTDRGSDSSDEKTLLEQAG